MNKLNLYWRYATKVSLKYGLLNAMMVLDERRCRLTGAEYNKLLCAEKDEEFQVFLKRRFAGLISSWRGRPETAREYDNPPQAPVWMLWLQGWGTAPAFVRDMAECASLHVGSHPLRRLSLSNLDEYLEIPGRYYDLFHAGKITPAHFSDIVRMNLLREHGGLWIDASVLLTKELPEEVFTQTFWTAKGLNPQFRLEPRCVDITKQVTYFMAAKPQSLLYSFVCSFLDEYLMKYETVLDYLLINHILKIAREELPVVTREYCSIPKNNSECEMLSALVDCAHRGEAFAGCSELLRTDTYIFKLSTRGTCALESSLFPGRSFIWEVLSQCAPSALRSTSPGDLSDGARRISWR